MIRLIYEYTEWAVEVFKYCGPVHALMLVD